MKHLRKFNESNGISKEEITDIVTIGLEDRKGFELLEIQEIQHTVKAEKHRLSSFEMILDISMSGNELIKDKVDELIKRELHILSLGEILEVKRLRAERKSLLTSLKMDIDMLAEREFNRLGLKFDMHFFIPKTNFGGSLVNWFRFALVKETCSVRFRVIGC